MPIIANVIGGLGNQMFQYAAGRVLAEKHGSELLLDTRMFNGYGLHNGFELERLFCIDSRIAKDSEIRRLIGWRASRIGRRLMADGRLKFLQGRHYYKEQHISFNEEFLSLPDDCYLIGFWQSERYFEVYEKLIREQFRFKCPFSERNRAIAEKIERHPNAVSLHVRRGDYVANARTNAVHGACTLDYYERAMSEIQNRLSGVTYFVFSDDVEWARNNLSIQGECYFIDHNAGQESYNDMRLMSLCNHHIIANSSFSWWGAWLNPSQNKIVIAPRRWFANGADCSTHVPADWLRV